MIPYGATIHWIGSLARGHWEPLYPIKTGVNMSLEEQLAANTAALNANTAALTANTAALGKAPKAAKGAKEPTESTQPAASTATPGGAAPAATGQQAQSPAASAPALTEAEIQHIIKLSKKSGQPLAELQTNLRSPAGLLVAATEAIIVLAGAYSRENAVGILGKKRGANGERAGVTRCSDLNALDHRPVLDEALTAIAAAEAAAAQAKASESLV